MTAKALLMTLALDIVLSGLVLGGMYALIALGLTLQYGIARIMNLSYGEMSRRRGVCRALPLQRHGGEPDHRAARRRAGFVRSQLAALPDRADAAGPARKKPGHAGGRQHPWHIRSSVRHPGPDAADLRRLVAELFVPVGAGPYPWHHARAQPHTRAAVRRGHRRRSLSFSDTDALRHGVARDRGQSRRGPARPGSTFTRPRRSPSRSAARLSARAAC